MSREGKYFYALYPNPATSTTGAWFCDGCWERGKNLAKPPLQWIQVRIDHIERYYSYCPDCYEKLRES